MGRVPELVKIACGSTGGLASGRAWLEKAAADAMAAGEDPNSKLTRVCDVSPGLDPVVSQRLSDGCPVLTVAMATGNYGMARLLIGAGADVNVSGIDGTTPLMLAMDNRDWMASLQIGWRKKMEFVEMLLNAGADVGASNVNGMTALMFAARSGFPAGVDRLLGAGASLAGSIGWASMSGSRACVEKLLSEGASPDEIGSEGHRPLGLAAAFGGPVVLGLLLKAGADPMARGFHGMTALMMAADQGDGETAEAMLPLSDPLDRDDFGNTALMFAAKSLDHECVRVLLPFSDVTATNNAGFTAATLAGNGGDAALSGFLAEATRAAHEDRLLKDGVLPSGRQCSMARGI